MQDPAERTLEALPFYFGEILVRKAGSRFVLCHRHDHARDDLKVFRNAEDAIEIARYDDTGNYRALKTAPNLRHGWRLELGTSRELGQALDNLYPGRLAIFAAWKRGRLHTTPLRETLHRQSGMYRIAAKISDAQINDLVAGFCRSSGGCLRTILWKVDQRGRIASTKLPTEKFDPTHDQVQAMDQSKSSAVARAAANEARTATIPLLCQEPCNLLVAACRKVVTAR